MNIRQIMKRLIGAVPAPDEATTQKSDRAEAADLRGKVAGLLRQRDALIGLLAEHHEIAFLKGPRVTHRMLKMAVHEPGRDIYISECIRKYGIWEPTETDYLLDNLNEGDIFIDIGANIGYYSILAAALVGNAGSVICFEPDPRNYKILELNLALNDAAAVTAINAAVSDDAEGGMLYRSAENLGDHRFQRAHGAADAVPVQTMRLEPDMLRRGTGDVTVKIDTQGWEGKIILGNVDTLRSATRIIFEWSPRWVAETGVEPMALLETLDAAGYDFRVISEERRAVEPFDLAQARILLPALLMGKGTTDDPNYLDLVAERRPT